MCMAGFFLSLIPSSLTNYEIPNALRVSLHWPLISLLTGVLIVQAEALWRWTSCIVFPVAVIFAYCFLNVYFSDYRERSKGMFDYGVYKDAQKLETGDDWNDEWKMFLIQYRMKDFHTRYYLMNRMGVGCKESFKIWDYIYNALSRGRRY